MRGLDTYYGRRITSISSDNEGNWFVELDGGVRIINQDQTLSEPKIADLSQLAFLAATFQATATTMIFGIIQNGQITNEYRVVLNPSQYAIYDRGEQSTAWNPQLNQNVDIVIPDYPADREQVGPEAEQTQDSEIPSPQLDEVKAPKKATKKSRSTKRKSS